MDLGTETATALSEGRWEDLERLCTNWCSAEPRNFAPKALQIMAWMFAAPPRPFELFSRMDELIDRKGDLRRVQKWCETLQTNDNFAASPQFVAFHSLIEGVVSDSYASLDRAISRFPGSPEALVIRGLFAQAGEKTSFFENAVTKNPKLPIALFLLATEYAAAGRKKDSVAQMLRVLEVCPDLAEANFVLGKEALDTSQLVAAAHFFRRVMALQPASQLGKQAKQEIDSRLATVGVTDSGRPVSEVPPFDLEAIPETTAHRSGTPTRLAHWKIIVISIASVFIVGGPIAMAFGTHDARVGVAAGVAVYLILRAIFGRRD